MEPVFELASPALPLATDAGMSWIPVVAWAWAAGAGLRLAWLAVGLARLGALARAGTPTTDDDTEDLQRRLGTSAAVRSVPDLGQPVTFGVWRPVVLVPASLSSSTVTVRRAALAHELLHVARRDWLWVMAEELLRAAFWFHPSIWWITSRIRRTREEYIDHLAVLATGNRRGYIEALLAFADVEPHAPAPAFAQRPHLVDRIVLLSKEAAMSSRRVIVSGAIVAALFAAGSWYASAVFPIMTAPVVRAEAAGAADLQLPAQPPAEPNRVTPENPIPRRLFSTPIPYPAELRGTNAGGAVQLAVVLDASGSVASVTGVPTQTVTDLMKVFIAAASAQIRQWRYEPPAQAPLQFYMFVTFTDGPDAMVSQSDLQRVGTGFVARPASAPPLPPPAPPAPGTLAPIRVGGQVKAPTQLRKVNPVYPQIAMSARVQGVVILELTIDQFGRVVDAKILRSIPLLDQAAIDAVRQWEYMPTLLNGVPVPVVMTATVQFSITSSGDTAQPSAN
jgi:protein TonB